MVHKIENHIPHDIYTFTNKLSLPNSVIMYAVTQIIIQTCMLMARAKFVIKMLNLNLFNINMESYTNHDVFITLYASFLLGSSNGLINFNVTRNQNEYFNNDLSICQIINK